MALNCYISLNPCIQRFNTTVYCIACSHSPHNVLYIRLVRIPTTIIALIVCNYTLAIFECAICDVVDAQWQKWFLKCVLFKAMYMCQVKTSDSYSKALGFESQLDPRFFPCIYFSLSLHERLLPLVINTSL